VGITSTIPVEIVFAGGLKPLDLNNVFITSPAPEKLLKEAEAAGFGHNICAWIKGIYSAVKNHNLGKVIAVTGGDCSNTVALSEILISEGIEVIFFNYPPHRNRSALKAQLDSLARTFSVPWKRVLVEKERLDRIRMKLEKLDRLTYQKDVISGFENHLFLVSSSDFESDPEAFEEKLNALLEDSQKRPRRKEEIRLGYLGVPSVYTDLYERLESMGARVVFNEVQRQFSMPYGIRDIVDQYLTYTYPYSIDGRLVDIGRAVHERQLDGLIHYTQNFCFRQIYDILIRKSLSLPILTLEGDRPGPIDGRTAVRLETFIEILRDRKRMHGTIPGHTLPIKEQPFRK
jgi:benzoyl-CoA reductase/2-hydroxyglutaryl-CoA dehydratase subunit BcrC/BadD/HgdB